MIYLVDRTETVEVYQVEAVEEKGFLRVHLQSYSLFAWDKGHLVRMQYWSATQWDGSAMRIPLEQVPLDDRLKEDILDFMRSAIYWEEKT